MDFSEKTPFPKDAFLQTRDLTEISRYLVEFEQIRGKSGKTQWNCCEFSEIYMAPNWNSGVPRGFGT